MNKKIIGFSLIELVVVILLIGILSAVAVPRLFQSTYKAYDAAIQRFYAEFASAHNVLAADWLLQGQQNVYDGFQFGSTADGYINKYGSPYDWWPNTTDPSDANRCIRLATELMGFPDNMFQLGAKPDWNAADTARDTAQKSGVIWFVEDTAGTAADAPVCSYWYIKGHDDRMSYSGVKYKAGDRSPIELVAFVKP